jgi:hypothetical protein
MSKADKMFEELGYRKKESKKMGFLEYTQKDTATSDLCISFEFVSKTIMCAIFEKGIIDSRALAINTKELQAINEKCKEIGWLDE